jgi:hypothetical protein
VSRSLYLLVVCCLSLGLSAVAEVRIAVLSPEGGEVAADLLTAELSAHGKFAVVERAELTRVWREQSLKAVTADALERAGGMVRAEVLAVLEGRPISKGLALNLRVVTVRSGMALGWWETTVTQEELPSWAKSAAAQVSAIAGKLGNDASTLTPISFVGFTSPATGSAGALLQREINSLFRNRLGAEERILILERDKLLEAFLEKALDAEEQKFWNGAFLLDGSINPVQLEGGSIEVSVRLSPPGGTPMTFNISGERNDLAALALRFTEGVLNALKVSPKAEAWNPSAEANRFYEEARLAARSGFWQEAMAAADIAIALGKTDVDTHLVRLAAYTGFITPDDKESFYRTVRPKFGVIEHFTKPPTPAILRASVDTAYQLRDFTGMMTPEGAKSRPVLQRAIEAVGEITLEYYFGAELREGNEDLLAQFRGAMRLAAKAYIAQARESRLGSPGNPVDEKSIKFIAALRTFAALWGETPEESVELLREFRSLPFWYSVEEEARQSNSRSWIPTLGGWKWSDRARAETVWKKFEAEPRPVQTLSAMPERKKGWVPQNSISLKPSITVPPAPAETNHVLPTIAMAQLPLVATNSVVHRVAWDGAALWIFQGTKKTRSWSDVRSGGSGFYDNYHLTAFNPATSTSEHLEIPERYFSFQQQPGNVQFAVVPTQIVFLFANALVRYDRATKTFSDQPLPLAEARLFQAGDNIILYNSETILLAKSTKFSVLASTRRRPALPPLDLLPSFEKAEFGLGRNGSLAIQVASETYEWDGTTWKPIPPTQFQIFTTGQRTFSDFMGRRIQGSYADGSFTLAFIPFKHSEARFELALPDGNAACNLVLPNRIWNGNTVPESNATVAGRDLFIWSSRMPAMWHLPAKAVSMLVESRVSKVEGSK